MTDAAGADAPTTTFRSLALADNLLRKLDELGYEQPTPIQAAAIPLLLEGLDLIGQAQTGTGKTAAFEQRRDGRGLDRRGGFVADIGQRAQQRLWQRQVGELDRRGVVGLGCCGRLGAHRRSRWRRHCRSVDRIV